MIQQTQQSGGTTRAIMPIRSLAELREEGVRRIVETDLTPRLTFPVDPRWYERYWYGERSPSKRSLLATTLLRLCRQLPTVSGTIVRAFVRTTSALALLAGTTGKVRTSSTL